MLFFFFLIYLLIEAKEKKKQQLLFLLGRGETETKRLPLPLPTPLLPGTVPMTHKSSSLLIVRPSSYAPTVREAERQRNEVIFKSQKEVIEPRF